MNRLSKFVLGAWGAAVVALACQSGTERAEQPAPLDLSIAEAPASESPASESPAAGPEAPEPTAAEVASEAAPVAPSGLDLWRDQDEAEPPPAQPDPFAHRPEVFPVATASGPLTAADNALSQRRYLSQMQPWDQGGAIYFKTLTDPEAREAARRTSLLERARLRAFEGAPPAMSHSEDFSAGSKTCLDCHDRGMAFGERVAHPMSHEPLINCSQCHVEESAVRAGEELLLPENDFVGLRFERRGVASMAGAPPPMPHGSHMRTRCLSCHGEFGYPGLRTTHPMRSNCVQCHVEVPPR